MARTFKEYQQSFYKEYQSTHELLTVEDHKQLFFELEKDYIQHVRENPQLIFDDAEEILKKFDNAENYAKLRDKLLKESKEDNRGAKEYLELEAENIAFLHMLSIGIQIAAADACNADKDNYLLEIVSNHVVAMTNGSRPDKDKLLALLARFNASIDKDRATRNYITFPLEKIIHPNDKISNNLRTATDDEWKAGEMQIIEQKQRGNKQQIISTLNFDLQTMQQMGVDRLDSFDFLTLHTCMAIKAAGNTHTTVNIIYKAMTGKDSTIKTTPTPIMKKAILDSLEKLMTMLVTIDATGICFEYGYEGKGHYHKRPLLPAGIEGKPNENSSSVNRNSPDFTINNADVDEVIEFYKDSPLMEIAMMKNRQVITYEKKLLNVPLNVNRQNIVIPPYLIHRIKNSEHKEMRNTILIDTIIQDTQWTGERKRLVKIIEKCFNYWQDECKFIRKYEIEKDGHKKAIKITFQRV